MVRKSATTITCSIQGEVIGFARGWEGSAQFSVGAVVFRANGQLLKSLQWLDGRVVAQVIPGAAWNRAVSQGDASQLDAPLRLYGHSAFWIMRPAFMGRVRAVNDLKASGSLFGEPHIGPSGVWACYVQSQRAEKMAPRWLIQYFEQALSNAQRGQWAAAMKSAELACDLDRKFSPPVVALLEILCDRCPPTIPKERARTVLERAYEVHKTADYADSVKVRRGKLLREITSMGTDVSEILNSLSAEEQAWIRSSSHPIAESIRRAYQRLQRDGDDFDARDDLAMSLDDMRARKLINTVRT